MKINGDQKDSLEQPKKTNVTKDTQGQKSQKQKKLQEALRANLLRRKKTS